MNPGDCKNKTCNHYETYLQILRAELVPALGCTEPIAIAYAAAVARRVLGEMPKRIIAACSSNIIKNVKSVIVPTTGDLRGIEASAILGAVAAGGCGADAPPAGKRYVQNRIAAQRFLPAYPYHSGE